LMFLKYRERISCSVILQIILMPAYNPWQNPSSKWFSYVLKIKKLIQI
jgi:hypothetical protein